MAAKSTKQTASTTPAKAPVAKKAAKAATANGKAAAKKTPAKAAAPKATANGQPRTKKEGLRKAQIRILAYLASPKGKGARTRAEIASGAPCDTANCVELIGSRNPEVRAANDAKHFPSLLSLGFVCESISEETTGVSYEITPTGHKAAEKAAKEAAK